MRARRYAEFADRRRAWYRLVDSDILALLRRGRVLQARRQLHTLLDDDDAGMPPARHRPAAAPSSATTSLAMGERRTGP